MSQMFTIEVAEDVVNRARKIAESTHRPIEAVLSDWFASASHEPPLEILSDEQLLAVVDMQMEEAQQEELSVILAHRREGQATLEEEVRFEELMQRYRRGMVRKAHALKIAVERGLRPPLA